jgi:precorrin-3B C17-methyltransferase
VLQAVNAVVGYTTYIDLVKPLLAGKEVVATGMRQEVARVEAAIDLALGGKSCAIVSSGDPGIYAMAGLVFEMCRQRGIPLTPATAAAGAAAGALPVEVVPGIPALCAGAALLGAPLTHDFAAVSLSDLLTPWEKIAGRLDAAAGADFVIVLYNPKSKKRDWQLARAQEIVLRHRSADTPVGIVTSATREGQRLSLLRLADLKDAPVDMQTVVFIGNTSTTRNDGFMVTPRGYTRKYDLG